MKILFLHLSDIHIKDKYSISQFHLKKITHAVRAHDPFDHMFLIVSGDVAYSGKANQYENAFRMIGRLINLMKIECDYHGKLHIFVVPGNHDVDLSNDPLTTSELVKLNKENAYYKQIDVELERQIHFFNFARRNNLFAKNRLFDRKMVRLSKNFNVEVNLINSAVFSTLEEDKGLHFLPMDVIQYINNPTGANFVITIMHHPTDWFIDSTMQSLENVIYSKSSLVFYGHKHYQTASMVISQESQGTLIHAGGCLCDKNDWSDSQFLIGKLDVNFENDILFRYTLSNYKWNQQQKQYETISTNEYNLPNKPSTERGLVISPEFRKKLLNDIKQGAFDDFTKYYVFPRIETSGLPMHQSKEFVSDDDFIDEIMNKGKVMIYGQHNTGKTTLLKWLFLQFLDRGFAPILCDLSNVSGSPKRIVKNCFEDIYSENPSDFERFQQLSRDKKIFIVDDVDLIKREHFERLVEAVRDEFAYFIFASREIFDLDMIEKMKLYLGTSNSIYKYQLTMFYSDKRTELIRKAVECHLADQGDTSKIIDAISDSIKSQKRLIRFDPDFILRYVSYYCKNVGDSTFRTTNIFSKVFEANLVNSLNKYGVKISVDRAFMLLSEIAYNVHFQKIYPIQLDLILSSIDNYNREYGANVSSSEALDLFEKSKILIPTESGDYIFSNKSYLAFFVARRLNVQYHATGDDTDLQHIIKNTCFGINADILLFITYITDNVRILRFILDMVDSYTFNWDQFSLDKLPRFLSWKKNHHVELPDKGKEIERHQESEIIEEKNLQNEIETIDLYAYSDEEAEKHLNRIIRAVQLLSIVSRCLPIFEYMMKVEEKERFIKQIYELPNKIFQVWAKQIDEEAEEFVQYFEKQPDQYYAKQRTVSTQDIVQALQWAAMSFLLDLYRMSMGQAVKEHTLVYFENFPKEKHNQLYGLQHLIALEVQGTSSEFVSSATDFYSQVREPLLRVMVKRVASNASVFKKMGYRERQRINEVFFKKNKTQRQRLFIHSLHRRKYQDE